jgi:hypothetical protein
LNLIRVMPAKGQDISMAASAFLARLTGPLLVIVGLSVLFDRRAFRAMAEEFLASRALMFLSGFVLMPAGLAIILTHNVWTADWRVLITLVGWLVAIGGAIRLLAPQQVTGIAHSMLRNPQFIPIAAGLWLVIGAVLCFFGYIHH